MTPHSDRSEITRRTPSDLVRTAVANTDADATVAHGSVPSTLPVIPDIEIGEIIGRGGMGVVYKGRQPYIDRTVAIKLLLVDTSDGDEFIRRFQREAKILAGLSHPHIVSCYQAGITGSGDPYLVMEYIDGPNLRDWLNSHGAMNEKQTISIIRDLAQALEHAHGRSIIHRDVKPENILLQKREGASAEDFFPYTVKLVDLGLARPTRLNGESSLTKQGMMMGTPATMAPEQFEDPEGVDFKADMYGLGCVLYHSLTGHPAFPSPTLAQLITAKISGVIPDPAQEVPGLSRQTLELGRTLLAHDKNQRPASYSDVITCCTQMLVAPTPAHYGYSASTKRLAVIGVTVLVAILAIVGYVVSRNAAPTSQVANTAVPSPTQARPEPPSAATPVAPPAADKPVVFAAGLPLSHIEDWTKVGDGQWDRAETVNDALSGMSGEIDHPLAPGLWSVQGVLTLANEAERKTDSAAIGVIGANGVRYAIIIKNLDTSNLIEVDRIESDGTPVVISADSRHPKGVHVVIRHDTPRFLDIETDDQPLKQAISLPPAALPITAIYLLATNGSLSTHGPVEVTNFTVSYPKP